MIAEAVPVAEDTYPTTPAGDVALPDVVAECGSLRAVVPILTPAEWERVAAMLFGLLDRAPLKGEHPAMRPHRLILGALAHDLRTYARLAGEPVGLEVDLRAAGSKLAERRVRELIDWQDRQAEQRMKRVETDDAAYWERVARDAVDKTQHEDAPDVTVTPAAPEPEDDDPARFL